MAEDSGDKTEAPTARRREEAREQGNIARSSDLTAAALLLASLLLMNSFGPGLIKALRNLMVELFSSDSLSQIRPDSLGGTLVRPLVVVVAALAPLLLGGLIVAVILNILQVGFFFTPSRLQPNFSMLNPMRGLSRLVQPQNLVHMCMSLFKVALVGAVAWSAISDRIGMILSVPQLDFQQIFGLGASIIYAVGMRIVIVLLILAILDYAYQKFNHEKELRMTKQEVKEEMRRMEGDPKIKQRRRQIATQMHARKLKKDVPTADVIVTNPTEFAIALKYDSTAMHAPRVIAKGQGYMAQRIREIAIEHGIPIVERKPLARALYKLVDVGQEIPEQFYSAVAEILAYVYELSGKLQKRAPVRV